MHTSGEQCVTQATAPHLIRSAGSEWGFWRWACVRGAGFPAAEVLELAVSEAILKAAEEVYAAEERANAAREQALEQVLAALDSLRQNNQWGDKQRRNALLKARDKLRTNELPNLSSYGQRFAAVEDFHDAVDQIEKARTAFRAKFHAFAASTSQHLRETAASPRFREAVIWQNRAAVHRGLDSLLRKSQDEASRSSRQRQNEELVASYIQRYCAKNDTIGFFGPVGWARFVDEKEPLTLRPGKDLAVARKVYFESWPIEALAAVIARDRRIYPWLAPILMPFIRVEGQTLCHPIYGQIKIPPQQAVVLENCDGRLPAYEVAKKLLRSGSGFFRNETEIYKAMEVLAEKRFLYWDFNIPSDAYPEKSLRSALELIEEPSLRERSLSMLSELELARTGVEAAAGNPEKLDIALENLEETFTRLTGVAATRAEGKMYAGRTLVYEDSRRDAEVLLGRDFLEALNQPLSLLLISARWLTSRLAKVYEDKLTEIYETLVRTTGKNTVEATSCWLQAMPYLLGEDNSLADPIQQEFQAKWERILQLNTGTHAVHYSTGELHARVMEEFSAAQPGWTVGRYHCPDIMIAAASEYAIRTGDYLLVLGELHMGGNTLTASLFVNQHPSPEELVRAVERDLGTSNIVAVQPRQRSPLARTSPQLFSATDLRLEYALGSFTADRSKALPVSALVIEKRDGKLIARTRDNKLCVNAIELVGGRFSDMVLDSFKMLVPKEHSPRVLIDRLIVKRESWRFAPAALDFVRNPEPADRFLQVRAWARAHQIPRFVFFGVPVERKPAYLDFDSPIFVDIFCKMVRRTLDAGLPQSTVDIAEMVPATDQCWLRDAENRRYTSELRIVAVDLSHQLIKPTGFLQTEQILEVRASA